MSNASTGYKTINGNQVYYSKKGNGPPIVFVHGWSLNLSYWDKQVSQFSDQFTTLSYDWRGMGRSDGAEPVYTMAELTDDLRKLIEEFGLQKPIICGHSEGGGIVMKYAATYPDDIGGLILADTAIITTAERIKDVLSTAMLSFVLTHEFGHPDDPLKLFTPVFEKEFYSSGFIKSNPDFIAGWRKQFESNSVPAMINGLKAWAHRMNVEDELSKLDVPTLLLWGTLDAVIKKSQMEAINEAIPGSMLVELQDSGHMTPVEVPTEFNSAMSQFFNGISQNT